MLPSGSQFVYWDTNALLKNKNLSTNTRVLYNGAGNHKYYFTYFNFN